MIVLAMYMTLDHNIHTKLNGVGMHQLQGDRGPFSTAETQETFQETKCSFFQQDSGWVHTAKKIWLNGLLILRTYHR